MPTFQGGNNSKDFIKVMKNWFYYRFKKNTIYITPKSVDYSRKLTQNWQELVTNKIKRVGRAQPLRGENGVSIPLVQDGVFFNTYHNPVWIDMPGDYNWGDKGAGRRQVETVGHDKSCFTLKFSCSKSSKNLPPYVIFKVAVPTENPARDTIAYRIKERLPDNVGRYYSPEDKIHLVVSKTANSNGELPIDMIEKVILPIVGIFEGKRGGVLVDDFRGHSHKKSWSL